MMRNGFCSASGAVRRFAAACARGVRRRPAAAALAALAAALIAAAPIVGCHSAKAAVVPMELAFEYDDAGRITARSDGEGRSVRYDYDEAGRLEAIRQPGREVHFGYDGDGSLVRVGDGSGRTEYRYDAFGRLVRADFRYSPPRSVVYEYDPWNRVSGVRILSNGRAAYEVRYEHDLFGNLAAVEDDLGRVTYSHLPEKGQVVRRLPNGITTTLTYSASGKLLAVRHVGRAGDLIAEYRYSHDAAGNVVRVEEQTDTETQSCRYEWDARGYLSAWQRADGTRVRYRYDAMGNRVAKTEGDAQVTYGYDRYGRLTGWGTDSYEYDGAGYLEAAVEGGRRSSFGWDAQGRLLSAQCPDGTVRYGYDGVGNLVERRQAEQVTHYLPNPQGPPGCPLAEFDGSGALKHAYMYGDVLLGRRGPRGSVRYFLEDGFSSVRRIVNWEGEVVGTLDYSPFAEVTRSRGEQAGGFRMAGEWQDPTTRYTIILGRVYDSKTGRYIGPDPLAGRMGRGDSLNRYAHACAGAGIFPQPRCNQTHRRGASWWLYDLPEIAESTLGELQDVLDQGGLYQLPFDLSGVGELAELAGRQLGDPGSVSWDELALASQQTMGDVGDLTAHVARFYGSRMDRPYPWWSPMKWLRQEEYERRRWQEGVGDGARRPRRLRRDERPGDRERRGPWWPDDGGPPGGAAHPFGPGGALFSPLKSEAPGGIDLDVTAHLLGGLGEIVGAVFDPESGKVVLVGEEDVSLPSIRVGDLAVALNCALSGQAPMFSLDPADPGNPEGPWLSCVYLGPIEDTTFGEAMFQADWLLKAYSFGVDENGGELDSAVPGFMDIFELSFADGTRDSSESWMRFWITCDEATLGRHGRALRFDRVRMKVNTEKMWRTRQGLQSSEGEQDPLAERFAGHFTEHYEDFSAEQPAFARLKQLACAVALANWLREVGVPLDLSWAREYANAAFNTPERVSALSRSRMSEKRQSIPGGVRIERHTVYLFGGVDLGVKAAYQHNDPGAAGLERAVQTALAGAPDARVVSVRVEDRELRGVVLPLTRAGHALLASGALQGADGNSYRYDERMRVTRVELKEGGEASFVYSEEGDLSAMSFSTPDGWRAQGRTTNGGSEMTVTSPDADQFEYSWDREGYLEEVKVNGGDLAQIEYDHTRSTVRVSYPGHVEMLAYDAQGRLTSRSVEGRGDGRGGTRGSASFSYDEEGRVTEVAASGGRRASVEYRDGRVARIATGRDEISYRYDRQGRLVAVEGSETSVECRYNGERVSSLRWCGEEGWGEATFADGRLVAGRDELGNRSAYRYDGQGNLTQAVDPAGCPARYEYDAAGRMSAVHLPSGATLEFRYGRALSAASDSDASPARVARIMLHPAAG